MRVQVVAHNPAWRGEFEAEAAQILGVLGNIVVRLHHIGSTAIPGIFAKPIIDCLLEVDDLDTLDNSSALVRQLGYEAMGEFGIPGRRYFRKDDSVGIRTHQIHAFKAGSKEVMRHLAFRDYMIEHPAEAGRCSDLKRTLADAHPDDIEAYMSGKDAYIKTQDARAIEWRSLQESKNLRR